MLRISCPARAVNRGPALFWANHGLLGGSARFVLLTGRVEATTQLPANCGPDPIEDEKQITIFVEPARPEVE